MNLEIGALGNGASGTRRKQRTAITGTTCVLKTTLRRSRLVGIALLGIALWVSSVFAAGNVVGPRQCRLTFVENEPIVTETTNNTPTGWKLYLSRTSGAYTTPFRSYSVAQLSPSWGKELTIDCRGFALADGQWYVIVKATNAAGDSPPSNEAPFVWDTSQPEPDLRPPTGPWLSP